MPRHHQHVLGDPAGRRSDFSWRGAESVEQSDAQSAFSLHTCCRSCSASFGPAQYGRACVGQQNKPAGVEPKSSQDTVAFTPYATRLKDGFHDRLFLASSKPGSCSTCRIISAIQTNSIPANPKVTPPTHICAGMVNNAVIRDHCGRSRQDRRLMLSVAAIAILHSRS